MAKISNSSQFITYSESYNMVEKRSALKNSVQQVFTKGDLLDDIHEAFVPYEYVYRTMLSQSGTGSVQERVLNFRDADFFSFTESAVGLLDFTRSEAGVYSSAANFTDLDLSLLSFSPRYSKTSDGEIFVEIVDDSLVITTFDSEGLAADGVLDNFLIEFRYRQRGAAFQAVLAEMNSTGSEIAITMSELINDYGISAAGLLDSIVIASDEVSITTDSVSYADDVLIVAFTADPALTSDSVVTVSYDAAAAIESLSLGLLDAFSDMEVVNNIPVEEE